MVGVFFFSSREQMFYSQIVYSPMLPDTGWAWGSSNLGVEHFLPPTFCPVGGWWLNNKYYHYVRSVHLIKDLRSNNTILVDSMNSII